MADRREQARSFLREILARGDWEGAIEESVEPDLRELSLELIGRLRAGDLEAALAGTSPDAVIKQPPELPGARTYRGHDGLIEAFVDWPSQWEDTTIDPVRTWQAGPGVLISHTHQRVRGIETGLEFDADFWFVFRWRDGLLHSWTMHASEEAAEEAAARA